MGILQEAGVKVDIFSFLTGKFGLGALIIFASFMILLVSGIIMFSYYQRKLNQQQFKNKIPIFKIVNGRHYRVDIDDAREIYVPNSNVGLFYLKKYKIYIAKPTMSMGLNEYWYYISENGEWVNFVIDNDPNKDSLAQANYDHRDTRYAYINLKEIIKKNYSDKSVQWWKEYSPLITFVVVSFIFILGCWFLLYKIGGLIEQLGPLLEQQTKIAESLSRAIEIQQNLNSGLIK